MLEGYDRAALVAGVDARLRILLPDHDHDEREQHPIHDTYHREDESGNLIMGKADADRHQALNDDESDDRGPNDRR
jgi:hypothetical protein